MHVFVTGGTGQTGPAIVTELVGSGHQVTGLARSDASAARLEALGATPLRGSLEDTDVLASGASQADGVVHMANGGDFSDPASMTRREVTAINALGEALVGTGRPFLSTSGTLVLPAGRVSAEGDAPDPRSIGRLRIPGEQACLGFAEQRVRAVVVRLAPTVHGPRDHGFIPPADRPRPRDRCLGVRRRRRQPLAGRPPSRRRRPLPPRAREGPAGHVVHGVGESAVPFRSIAEKIGDELGLPVRSVSAEDAGEHFGNPFMAVVFGTDTPASSDHTRQLLDWAPNHPTLLDDLETGDYFYTRP